MCLLNVIGARGRAVYDAMQFAADGDNLKFAIVKKKFEEHCIPKQNKLIERDRFNARTQKTGESGIQYVSVLRKLAESCNFGIQEDSIIRDQLVRGMLPDEKLRDKLYEEDDLNLEKAIKIITTHEIRATMTSAASVDAVYHQGRGRGRSRGSSHGRGSSRGSSRGRGRGSSRGRGRGSSQEVGQSRGASAANSQRCNKVMLYTILMFVPQRKLPVFTVRRRVIMPESVNRITRMRWR